MLPEWKKWVKSNNGRKLKSEGVRSFTPLHPLFQKFPTRGAQSGEEPKLVHLAVWLTSRVVPAHWSGGKWTTNVLIINLSTHNRLETDIPPVRIVSSTSSINFDIEISIHQAPRHSFFLQFIVAGLKILAGNFDTFNNIFKLFFTGYVFMASLGKDVVVFAVLALTPKRVSIRCSLYAKVKRVILHE